jgi:lysophospholipase L1-like esterase
MSNPLETSQSVISGEKISKTNTYYGVSDSWVKSAFETAKYGRGLVDVPLVGDSNVAANSSGWYWGLSHGFKACGGNIYSIGLVPSAAFVGSGFVSQHMGALSAAIGAQAGAPGHLSSLMSDFTTHNYAYVTVNAGIVKRTTFKPDKLGASANETWRYWLEYGDFGSGGGSFTMRCNLEQSPYTEIKTSASIPCNVGDNSKLTYMDVKIPTTNQHAMGFTSITANAWFGYMAVDRLGVDGLGVAGIATHLWAYYSGWLLTGSSATSFLKLLRSSSQARNGAYLARIRRKQMLSGYSPKIVVALIWGANDSSVSGDEFKANLIETIEWIRAAYSLAGGNQEELGFLLMVDHRYDDEGSAFQLAREAFSRAADEIAMTEPRVASFNLQTMFTTAEGLANGWYGNGGADKAHLSVAGYEALATRSFERVFGL